MGAASPLSLLLRALCLVLLLAFDASRPRGVQAYLISTEYNALQSLYNSANGAYWMYWGTGARWDFSGGSDPCTDGWEGVVCSSNCTDSAPCRVISVDLRLHNMSGVISNYLAPLNALEFLDLSLNRIEGSIPPTLGGMAALRELYLEYLCLSDNIPSSINGLNNLSALSLRNNFLVGPIPELNGLGGLELLDLRMNAVYNESNRRTPVANEISIRNISSLPDDYEYYLSVYLSTSCPTPVVSGLPSGLSGSIPASLWGLENLTYCFLSSNGFTGPLIPYPLQINISSMIELDVSFNRFAGIVPMEIAQLTSLTSLNLSYNFFFGSIPVDTLGILTNLHLLDLASNGFNGPIPDSINMMSGLQQLVLASNNLTSSIPTALFEISSLRMLSLGLGNCISGPIPSEIGSLSNLEFLELSDILLTGEFPKELTKLDKLYFLDLSFNRNNPNLRLKANCGGELENEGDGLIGVLPESIWNMTSLRFISLEQNTLSGTMPEGNLTNMARLETLRLTDNEFSSSVPSAIGNLSALTGLYLNVNSFTGTIPVEFGFLTNLIELDIARNSFDGRIPYSFRDLKMLKAIDVAGNNIGALDPIPSLIWELTQLTRIQATGNLFASSIPNDIGKLVNLETFIVDSNYLTGPLPLNGLMNCSKLEVFDIGGNGFTGTIPTAMAGLTNLVVLGISGNSFYGTIPPEILKFPRIEYLAVAFNSFTGTIPDVLDMPNLQTVSIYENRISGTIPQSVASLQSLRGLFLGNNILNGSIPSQIMLMSSLVIIDLSTNRLSGSIPDVPEGISMPKLWTLLLNDNALTGTFPTSFIRASPFMNYINLADNKLRGPMPEFTAFEFVDAFIISHNSFSGRFPPNPPLRNIPPMFLIDISANRITGSIPTYIGMYTGLQVMSLHSNQLTGTVPDVGVYPRLQTFRVNDNRLSGKIPLFLGRSPLLDVVLLQSNRFSGSIERIFNTEVLQDIKNIDLSENDLTGYLPEEIFNMSRLKTFAASSNGFRGSFPSTICTSKLLGLLVFDGISSRETACSPLNRNIPFFTDYCFKDSIPPCLLELPFLRYLYMSGNQLSGQLPEIGKNTSFQVIKLQNNRLSGTIPESYLAGSLSELDLSNNRLTGSLTGNVTSNMTLSLTVNRLSGTIPRVYESVMDLDILLGNLFYCDFNSPLPNNDPNNNQYTCGSNLLDYSQFVWIVAVIISLLGILIARYFTRSLGTEDRKKKFRPLKELHVMNLEDKLIAGQQEETHRWVFIERLVRWYEIGSGLSLGLPTNGSVDTVAADNGSFATRKSALRGDLERTGLPELAKFITSLLFIRNISIIIATFVMVLVFPWYPILKSFGYATHNEEYGWLLSGSYISGVVPTVVFMILWVLICVLFLVLVDVGSSSLFSSEPSVFLLHGFKELFSNDNPVTSLFHSALALFINVAVVLGSAFAYVLILISSYSYLFKISMQLVFSLFRVLWNSIGVPTCFSAMKSMNHNVKVFIYVFTLCFNNVISLVIAAALSDPSCFGEIFSTDQYDDVRYGILECVRYFPFLDFCREKSLVFYTSEFSTPPTYNYLCGSTIMRSFVPMLFYVYAAMLFLFPFLLYLMANVRKNTIPKLLRNLIPTILWPDECIIGKEKVFRPNNVMNSQLGHLAVLLTFGVMYPPLGVAIALTITTITSMWIIIIGRYAEKNLVLDRKILSSSELFKLDSLFKNVWASIHHSKWLLFFIAGLFFATTLFDIIGDETRPLAATIVVFTFVAFLLATFFGDRIVNISIVRKYLCGQRMRKVLDRCSDSVASLLNAMELPFNPSKRAFLEFRDSELNGDVWIADSPAYMSSDPYSFRASAHLRASSDEPESSPFHKSVKPHSPSRKGTSSLDDSDPLQNGVQMHSTRPM